MFKLFQSIISFLRSLMRQCLQLLTRHSRVRGFVDWARTVREKDSGLD